MLFWKWGPESVTSVSIYLKYEITLETMQLPAMILYFFCLAQVASGFNGISSFCKSRGSPLAEAEYRKSMYYIYHVVIGKCKVHIYVLLTKDITKKNFWFSKLKLFLSQMYGHIPFCLCDVSVALVCYNVAFFFAGVICSLKNHVFK